MTQAQFDKFAELSNELSPEWLTCDGELSPAQVRVREREIMKKWGALEKEVGVEITPEEFEDVLFDTYLKKEIDLENLGKKPKYVNTPGKWKRFKGEELPESAMKFMAERSPNYMSGWCEAWYKGNIDNTRDWFIVTPDGGYYKVDAKYMTWYRMPTGKIVGKCNWTKNALYKMRLEVFKGNEAPRDPNYQT